jgi:ADP-heptose:LPS heptosyltransferase
LAGRHFDLVIDAQRRVGASFLLRRVPHHRFLSGAGSYLLSELRPAQSRRKPPSLVRQLLDLVELASGRPADVAGTPPALPEFDALAAEVLPEGETYVGLAPGAGTPGKRWPLERYLELGAAQVAAGRRPVVFLGPEESSWTLQVREALPAAVLPLQAEAVARLGPSALITIALAKRLSAAVANDAGVGHMLAAANCPLVSLFGPTSPEKSAPLGGPARVLRAQDHAPSRTGDGGSDAQSDSIENIPLAVVREAVDDLLRDATETSAAMRPRGGESRLIGGEVR